MRRRTMVECFQEKTKLLLIELRRHPNGFKHFFLQAAFMNSNTAAPQFRAVEDEVVRLGPHVLRFGIEQRHILSMWRRKGMMHRLQPVVALVVFEQWEIGHPEKIVGVFGNQT